MTNPLAEITRTLVPRDGALRRSAGLAHAAHLRLRRHLACLRYRDVLLLQGTPLLGAACAMAEPSPGRLARLAVLILASVLLVAHIFLLNDWAGLSADLRDPNKAAAVFATRGISPRQILRLGLALLAASLALCALLGPLQLVLAAAIALLSFLYSGPGCHGKGMPLVSSALHLGGGVLHFLLGYTLFARIDARGAQIALFFALVFTAGHLTQEARDHDGDRISGIRTNAVTYGRTRTFLAGLAGFTLANVQLAVLAARGLLPAATAALLVLYPLHLAWSLTTLADGLSFHSIGRLQTRYRALYAIIGGTILVALLLQHQRPAG
jgi:4-hydroxybenzoate polyprenyltransferase